ncbi:MAG: glycoside hydrolase family 36 protein [Candidatus Neomarinimicrobiota bacterium]
MPPKIDYNRDQNEFLLTGVRPRPLLFTINVNYTINLPPAEIPRGTRSEFQPVPGGWRIEMPEIAIDLNWQVVGDGVEIILKLENRAAKPILLQNIVPANFKLIDWGLELERHRFYQHGYQSWSPCRPLAADSVQEYPRLKSFALMNQNVDSPFWGRHDGLLSSLFTVLSGNAAEPDLLLGFTEQRSGSGEFFLRNHGPVQLTAFLDYSAKLLAPGQRLVTEALLVTVGPADAIVNDYMARLGQKMQARVGEKSPAGWCSWYEFYTAVSERNLLDNVAALEKNRDLGVELVQLDDGYQTAVGDWLSLNKKFPGGLENLAAEIKNRGFRAGIWLAPFLATRNSRLYREHPDWFLQDAKGRPVDCGFNPAWKARACAIDLTHPEVEVWLRSIFQHLVDWGFDYFKIDFIFAGLRSGKRRRPEFSPLETYRHGLQIIRDTIGDRFLLGCGAPLGPSVGYVDALRISEDVKEVWHSPLWEWLGRGCGVPSARSSLRNNLQRHFTHRRLWLNDPDCLLVRDRNTRLNPDEARTLVTILGLTGGMLFLSDNLSRLSRERLDWVRAVLPPGDLTGRPEDQFRHEYPAAFRVTGSRNAVLALVNWRNKRAVFDLADYVQPDELLFDFWQEKFWERTRIGLPAHGTLALQVCRRSVIPALVASDLHLTALADERITAVFDEQHGTLTVTGRDLARTTGRLWIVVPAGFTYLSATQDGRNLVIESWAEGVVLPIDRPAPWSLLIKFV